MSSSASSFVLPSVPAKLKQNRAERRPDHVVKRRFHNSCHVCKCGASPGVEHVRCRCGIMFCGRPRCCKRLGVEWAAFVKELMAGGQCPHCNSLTAAGVAEGTQCPNSNCKQKKKKGQESRKYSVGVVTSAQEVTPFAVSAAAATLPSLSSALAVSMKGAAGLLSAEHNTSLSQISLSSFVPSIGSLSLQSNLPTVANTNPIASLPLSQILALLGQQQQQHQSNATAAAILPPSASSLAGLSLPLGTSTTPQPLLSSPHPHAPSLHQQQQAAAAAALIAASVSVPSPALSALQLSGLGASLPDGLSLTAAQLKVLHSQLSPAYSPYNTQLGQSHSSSLPPSIQHTPQSLQLQSHSHSHSHSQSSHLHSPSTQRIADSAIAALLQANQQQQLQALHNAHLRIHQQQQQQQSLYPPVAPIGSFSSAALSSPPLPAPTSSSPPASMEELLAALIRQQQQPQSQPHHTHSSHQHPSSHHPPPQPSHSHSHLQSHSSQQSQSGQSFGGISLNPSLAAYLRQSSGVAGDVLLNNMQLPAAYNTALFGNHTSHGPAAAAATSAGYNSLSVQPLHSSSPHSQPLSVTGSPPSSHLASSSSPSSTSVTASHVYVQAAASSDAVATSLLDGTDSVHEDDRGSKWRKKIKREDWSVGSTSGGGTSGSNSSSITSSSSSGGSGVGNTPLTSVAVALMDDASHAGL